MKPKPTRSLSLPWTSQWEKVSGNHLLPRKKATSLTFPIYMLFISRSCFLTLSSRVSCLNSLTSPTMLLWMIHYHNHKYLYQLTSTHEQRPIGKNNIFTKENHLKPKWPTSFFKLFVPRLSIYRAKIYAFLVPPRRRTVLKTIKHPWTKIILSRGGRRKLFNPGLINKLIKIEWVSERHRPISDCLQSSWMLIINNK